MQNLALQSSLLESYLQGVKLKDILDSNKHINPSEVQRMLNNVIGAYLNGINFQSIPPKDK